MNVGALARLAVAAGLTAVILWKIDARAAGAALAAADWRWILAAVALVLVDRALNAYRWLVLLRPLAAGAVLRLRDVLQVFFVSTFVGTFLPGSVGGDAVRAVALSKHGIAMADSVASVLVDRVFGTLSILLVAAGAVWFAPPSTPAWLGPVTVTLAVVAAGGVIFGLFDDRAERLATGLLGRLTRGKLHKAGTNLLRSLRRYAHSPGALWNVLVSSIAVQGLRIVQAWMLGLSLGLDPGFAAYLVYIPVILVVMMLPISVSGIGTSQAAFVWLFGASGVTEEGAFALSVLFLALGVVGNLPGALLYAVRGLPSSRRGAPDPAIEENPQV
ncbi:MAG: lysylphosphatidylglycerol synthase transmembrane domain-containing protein [Vicinamibacterales bacterium]